MYLLLSEFMPALLVLVIPLSVHAGFLSTLADAFTEKDVTQVVDDVILYTPLDAPLLSANANAIPLSAIGGGDVFVEEGALVSSGPIGAEEISSSRTDSDEISVYVVRAGDSLSQIAEMYDVTSNTILWANSLTKSTDIREGDALVILPIVGVRHTVGKGETLASIVKKYDANLQEVLEYNSLASADDIVVGKELLVPGGELHTAPKVITSAKPTKTSGAKVSGKGLINPAPGSVKTQGIHGYNGVDLASAGGAFIPVVAALGGEVIVSKPGGWNGGYGNYIVIKHNNGTQTLYSHLSANTVAVGDWVNQGQKIGAMGNSGKSTGVHLHFEVRGGTNPF